MALSPQGYIINDAPKDYHPFFLNPDDIPPNVMDLINDLNDAVAALQTAVTALETGTSSITTRINTMSETIAALARSYNALNTALTEQAGLIQSVQSDANSAMAAATNAIETAANVLQRIIAVEGNISTINNSLDDILTRLRNAEYELTLKATKAELQDVNTAIDAILGGISQLNNDLQDKANTSDLQTVAGSVNQVAGDVVSLDNRLSGEISNLDIRLSAEIDAVEQSVVDSEARTDTAIDGLDTRVTALENASPDIDSGWLSLPIDNVNITESVDIKYRKKGGIVYLRILSSNLQLTAPSGLQLSTLPEGFRPSLSVYDIGVTTGYAGVSGIEILENGVIIAYAIGSSGTTVSGIAYSGNFPV